MHHHAPRAAAHLAILDVFLLLAAPRVEPDLVGLTAVRTRYDGPHVGGPVTQREISIQRVVRFGHQYSGDWGNIHLRIASSRVKISSPPSSSDTSAHGILHAASLHPGYRLCRARSRGHQPRSLLGHGHD